MNKHAGKINYIIREELIYNWGQAYLRLRLLYKSRL